MARDQWNSRTGFILAAIGSAVGLGTIWRFPGVAFENGGGAFLIPYFFALFTAGIPILIMEFSLGHKLRGSAPFNFSKLGNYEWFGWWQVAISFVISTYYSVILAWSLAYTGYAFLKSWGQDTQAFLYNNFLNVPEQWNTAWLGGLQLRVVIPLILVWIFVYMIMTRGISKGIERANMIFMPLLFFIVLLLAIRGVMLPGALDGLNALFNPDWSGIMKPSTWLAAYGQTFYGLSIAFAIMMTYASYLPEKSDINNNAFMTAFANAGFSLIAGIAVFSAVGFMAAQQGVPVKEIAGKGIGFAFIAFPKILNEMPMGSLVGVLFFLSLVFAGITSMVSIVETYVAAIVDKFGIERRVAINWSIAVATIVSFLYATGSGIYLLDTVDYFINNYGVAFAGLFEVVLVGWILNRTEGIREYNNKLSDFSVGSWWNFFIIVITPAVLGYMSLKQINTDLVHNYSNYPDSLIMVGWSIAMIVIIMGFYFQSLRGNRQFNSLQGGDTE